MVKNDLRIGGADSVHSVHSVVKNGLRFEPEISNHINHRLHRYDPDKGRRQMAEVRSQRSVEGSESFQLRVFDRQTGHDEACPSR